MARPLNSLKWRLGVWVILPAMLVSGIDLLITYRSTDHIATLVQQQLLKGSARIIAEQLVPIDGGYEISIPPAALELFATRHRDLVYYAVRGKDGKLIAGDADLPRYAGPLQIEQEQYFMATMRGEPVRTIAYASALPTESAGDFAVTEVAQTLRSHSAFRRDLFVLTIREHLILLAIVMVGLVVALRWTLSPLARFSRKLSLRQPGSLETLDGQDEPVELRPLVVSINDYAQRLDQALSSYERFVANTAHQLRTSFAIMSSQLNFAQRSEDSPEAQQEVLRAMQKSVAHGTRVINQLLVLAAVERNKQHAAPTGPVSIATTLLDTINALAPLAQQRRIDLGVDEIDDTLFVAAPSHLLGELASNLLDNAIKHSGLDAVVTVSLRRDGAQAILGVTDNGPGIPAAEHSRVFERFYRLDSSKPDSSGLGLAIVQEISLALHAAITLSTSPGGRGLRIEVAMPLAPPPSTSCQGAPTTNG